MARRGFLDTLLDALMGPPQRITTSNIAPYRAPVRRMHSHHPRCTGRHCANPFGSHHTPFCLWQKYYYWTGGAPLCKRCFKRSVR